MRFRLHGAPTTRATAWLVARITALDASHLRPTADPTTFEIAPGAASADIVGEIAAWAAREGLLIVELRAGAASLEERYLELTGDRDIEAAA